MLTGNYPLLADGNGCSHVLPYGYKWLLKNVKTAQLPLHISSQRSALCTNKPEKKRTESNTNHHATKSEHRKSTNAHSVTIVFEGNAMFLVPESTLLLNVHQAFYFQAESTDIRDETSAF